MKLVIATCCAMFLALPALGQQTGVGTSSPPSPGSALDGAQTDQPLSETLRQPGESESVLPDPGSGLTEPLSPDPQGSATRPRQSTTGQGETDQQSAETPGEGATGEQVRLPPAQVKIAGPGDVVPPVERNEQDVSTVLKKPPARRSD
jgi:hypothetical protein